MFQASKKQIQGGGFKYYFVKPLQKPAKGSPIFSEHVILVDISVGTTT